MASNSRQLANKWLKTKALLSDSYIARHIPASRLLNRENLRAMLSRYGMVVVKPVRGGGGIGVIKLEKSGSSYRLTHQFSSRTYSSFDGLMQGLDRARLNRQYLIQKGIRLATIEGRPIDYRVKHVKEKGRWVYRSMVGRLAKRGLFVTNLSRGGSQLTAAQGIRRSLSSRMVGPLKREMRHLTNASTALLERRFPGLGQLGYDYGIDHNGHIWILEVNTRPQ